jgi:hypothetical protein
MFYRLSLVSALIFGLTAEAQNHIDALRYSQESLWGSARYVAMGGAFGSLGADGSTSSSNPAGIATFTNGQFSSSINLNEFKSDGHLSKSSFKNENSFAKKSSVSIPNLNYVSANIITPEITGDWDRVNFGIGYNKLDDYNKSVYLKSTNSSNSLSDHILSNAEGSSFDDLNTTGQLAYSTYLIDTIGTEYNYNSPLEYIDDRTQTYNSTTSGGKNEFYISVGTAYQNKLFLGATVGLPSIEYREKTTITESNFEGASEGLNSFNYETDLFVDGSGINLKLGLIYKIDEAIRYGFALHTPTYYEVHEEYSSSINTVFNDSTHSAESYLGLFDYGLSTPFKIMNSLSFVLKKRAIISIEHEYLDYSIANLSSEFHSFDDENNTTDNDYSSASNIKLGAELRVHPQLSLRAGYAYYGSPLTDNSKDASKEYLTFGFGLKVNQYFFDFAMINSSNQNYLEIYPNSETATLNNTNGQFLISGVFKF